MKFTFTLQYDSEIDDLQEWLQYFKKELKDFMDKPIIEREEEKTTD